MVTFRSNNNNNRRPSFRRNDRSFKSNGDRSKFKTNFSSNDSFQRKVPGRNNHNASRLMEKYNDLAREALANEDKILSENYFQHADHFMRVLSEQEANRVTKVFNKTEVSNENVKEVSNENDKEVLNEKEASNENAKEVDTLDKVVKI